MDTTNYTKEELNRFKDELLTRYQSQILELPMTTALLLVVSIDNLTTPEAMEKLIKIALMKKS